MYEGGLGKACTPWLLWHHKRVLLTNKVCQVGGSAVLHIVRSSLASGSLTLCLTPVTVSTQHLTHLQTMDAVRRRLAPIRGIPTKSGKMADPNADIKEVFDFIDELPKAPAKMFDNIKRWVSGLLREMECCADS